MPEKARERGDKLLFRIALPRHRQHGHRAAPERRVLHIIKRGTVPGERAGAVIIS
ncbi:MAG: hypothetical protein IKP42_07560 [Ruminococcus sp.]|nr:hypothetical protein [Ruminococcus sp.]